MLDSAARACGTTRSTEGTRGRAARVEPATSRKILSRLPFHTSPYSRRSFGGNNPAVIRADKGANGFNNKGLGWRIARLKARAVEPTASASDWIVSFMYVSNSSKDSGSLVSGTPNNIPNLFVSR